MNKKELHIEDLQDGHPLPEILEAEWAKDQVMQLFDDLRDGAEVEHVQLKSIRGEGLATLTKAKQAFADGEAVAIQVRYVFENEMWCDTIMPGNPTTRIIRNRMPNTETHG